MRDHFPNSRLFQLYFLGWINVLRNTTEDYNQRNSISFYLARFQAIQRPAVLDFIEILGIARFYTIMAKSFNVEFVTIKLDSSEKKAFLEWADSNAEDYETLLSQTCDAGYKISLSYDYENSVYIVALTGKKDTPHNGSKCFTSRSNQLFEAIMLMLYKHWGLASGGSWDTIATQDDSWG